LLQFTASADEPRSRDAPPAVGVRSLLQACNYQSEPELNEPPLQLENVSDPIELCMSEMVEPQPNGLPATSKPASPNMGKPVAGLTDGPATSGVALEPPLWLNSQDQIDIETPERLNA